jgi:hypothetical protein
MAYKGRVLEKLAQERNVTVATLISQTIQEQGSIFRAAIALGVAPNSIQSWMKRHGYQLKTTAKIELVNN